VISGTKEVCSVLTKLRIPKRQEFVVTITNLDTV
jgi:hypothetical protein